MRIVTLSILASSSFLLARLASGLDIQTAITWAAGALIVAAAVQLLLEALTLFIDGADIQPRYLSDLIGLVNEMATNAESPPETKTIERWMNEEERNLGNRAEVHSLTSDLKTIDCTPSSQSIIASNIADGATYFYYVPSESKGAAADLFHSIASRLPLHSIDDLNDRLRIYVTRTKLLYNFSFIKDPNVAPIASWYLLTPPIKKIQDSYGQVVVHYIQGRAPLVRDVLKKIENDPSTSRLRITKRRLFGGETYSEPVRGEFIDLRVLDSARVLAASLITHSGGGWSLIVTSSAGALAYRGPLRSTPEKAEHDLELLKRGDLLSERHSGIMLDPPQ